jgi:hypothetical protein
MTRTPQLPGAILALVISVGALMAPATAEEQKETSWAFSAEARVRPEYRDNLDLESDVNDDTRLGLMRLRFGLDVNWKQEIRVFAQIQDSRAAGEEVSTASNEKNLDLHQGFADFAPASWKGLALRVGRQEWIYGEGRMIGAFDWDNIGRSFDGARLRWAKEKFTLDGLAARLTSRITAVPPASLPLVTGDEIGSSSTTGADLFGIYAHWMPGAGDEFDLYWLEFANHAAAPGELAMPGTTRIDAFGLRVKQTIGGFDVVFEGVAETGEVNGDDLGAEAAAIQAGWTWGEAAKVRLFGGYDYATGDEANNDGERQEFFNFFPTNHPLYGYADYFGWRNIKSPYAGVSAKRGKHFGLVKGHIFDLVEEKGPWKSAGGAVLGFDATGMSGTEVGTEIDLLYRYAWTEKAMVEAGAAYFSAGEFAEATRGSDASTWGYVMLTVRL